MDLLICVDRLDEWVKVDVVAWLLAVLVRPSWSWVMSPAMVAYRLAARGAGAAQRSLARSAAA